MHRRSVVALFCEDIRVEKSGVVTLVGVMPDNVNIPAMRTAEARGMIPKLCVYVKANFDVADKVEAMAMNMRLPDGNNLELGTVAPNIIAKAFDSAKKKNLPLAGVTMRAEFQPFPIIALGKILVEIVIDGETYQAAQLNLTHGEKEEAGEEQIHHGTRTIKINPTSSTEPQQPS